jgi:8-oxo-dGTP pyrophosphatase MutT (NUDIX family)
MQNSLKELQLHLETELKKPLPGVESHQKMVPTKDGISFRPTKPKADSKKSAVMILINYESSADKLQLLYTLRSSKLKSHSGQISFPGGKLDEGETFIEAALRETEEEVGIDRTKINVMGEISSLYVPPSNSLMHPVIGLSENAGDLLINPDEVEEAFYIDLDYIRNPSVIKTKRQNFPSIGLADVPYYDINKKAPLWGATAIITTEFLDIIKEF